VTYAASAGETRSDARVERRVLWSDALQREMAVDIYLPPGYDSDAKRRYPVLYMLHGLNGDQGTWEQCDLTKTATRLIEAGEIAPMIVVMPDGDNGYWVDQANNGPRFGTYVAEDLVANIDAGYRTVASRDWRAVGGMSMGGHGALQLAMNFPATFGTVGAHSVALRSYEQAFSFFGDRAYFRKHDPVQLFADFQGRARQFNLWIDVGEADPWRSAAESFHNQLTRTQISHEWRLYGGAHDHAYWRDHVADYLAFYDRSFASEGGSALAAP
jgi:enterochelin esterase-like enzyme